MNKKTDEPVFHPSENRYMIILIKNAAKTPEAMQQGMVLSHS